MTVLKQMVDSLGWKRWREILLTFPKGSNRLSKAVATPLVVNHNNLKVSFFSSAACVLCLLAAACCCPSFCKVVYLFFSFVVLSYYSSLSLSLSHFFLRILCSFHSGWTEQSETAAFSFSKSSWLLWAISSFPWRWSKATYAEERGENAIRRQQKREAQEEYCSYLLFFCFDLSSSSWYDEDRW